MHESLVKYINDHLSTPLAETEIEEIKNVYVPKKLRKHQYFLQEGNVCKHFGFIVKGAMRKYTIDDKGMEHIEGLGIENWWMGDRESWMMLTPSVYNIDAWEDTELLIVTRADMVKLLHHIPTLNEVVKAMDERHAIATQKRITASISLSAEKRYTHFVKHYPDLLHRFPQHFIASYLGITKETLSRIRSRATGR